MKLVACIAALLGLLLPARALAAEEAGDVLGRLDTSTPQARESAARTLAPFGPAALFALLSPAASGARDETLARACALQPQAELGAFLASLTRAALAPERLKPALLVLREAGSAHALAGCLDLAADAPDLEPELVGALSAICAREPGACEQALELARTQPLPQAEALARGLAAAHNAPGARAILRLSNLRPELCICALSGLLAEVEQLPRPADPELLALLREQLAREEHPAVQELLLLAGRIEDDECLPLLLERLSDARPELRQAALWSLRRISGLGLGPDPAAWTQWFREELSWWAVRAQPVLALLHSADPAAQRRALGELGQRYWRRQQVADELEIYLGGADSEGARMACGLLGRLCCASSAAALESRVADPDPAVQESARAALERLSGKKLPVRQVALATPARSHPQH